jgi:hypothetical protein
VAEPRSYKDFTQAALSFLFAGTRPYIKSSAENGPATGMKFRKPVPAAKTPDFFKKDLLCMIERF